MAKEIEVLYELKTPLAKAKAALAGFSARPPSRTVDTYYCDPLRDDLQPVAGRLFRCCRVRERDGAGALTYKIDKFRGDEWLYSDEHETKIANPAAAKEIVRHLGLRPLVTVKMTKVVYDAPGFEISLEHVDGLGNFIEIESRVPVRRGGEAREKAHIREFALGLGLKLGAETNAGKPELLLAKRRAGK